MKGTDAALKSPGKEEEEEKKKIKQCRIIQVSETILDLRHISKTLGLFDNNKNGAH